MGSLLGIMGHDRRRPHPTYLIGAQQGFVGGLAVTRTCIPVFVPDFLVLQEKGGDGNVQLGHRNDLLKAKAPYRAPSSLGRLSSQLLGQARRGSGAELEPQSYGQRRSGAAEFCERSQNAAQSCH